MSDLHGYLPKEVPECDVVCICGDIVPLEYQNDYVQSIGWFHLDFLPWANNLPCKKVVFVAGNHDFFLEQLSDYERRTPSHIMKKLLPGSHKGASKLVYLCDNSVEIDGVRFYGAPWVKDLSNWAFYKSDADIKEKFNKIPKKFDVLLTHMPSTLADTGNVLQGYYGFYGCYELEEAILKRDIKYALCGHVHTGNHRPTEVANGCKVVNVSLKDEDYKVNYPIFEFEI